MSNTYRVFAFSEDVISLYNESDKSKNFKLNDNIDDNFDTVIIFLSERNQKTLDVKFFKNGKMLYVGASYSYGQYPIFDCPIELAGTKQSEPKEEITFCVGDKVFDWKYGWMIVNEIESHGSIVLVDDSYKQRTFSKTESLRLSFTEYNFVTGGWSQEIPPKVGQWGWFWDDGDLEEEHSIYGKLLNIDPSHHSQKYYVGDVWVKYFSTENPFLVSL